MSNSWNLDNTYSQLPDSLYSRQKPVSVQAPETVLFNQALAANLGLEALAKDMKMVAEIFSGNKLPEGSEPIAQAYAGHQFGYFTMLGDGRAILLGEQKTTDGRLFDIQLKGAGRTAFSRRGDGRATLYSMLREYLMSEAMYHLGVPTSRSLAVVRTGEQVFREDVHEGAVLTRVTRSHIRVGTFEYIRKFCEPEVLNTFIDYTIERHYPELADAPNKAIALLQAVMHVQINLVVHWMRTGFIHGVMNTDNTSIAGETIDYGPCAFMNQYNLQTVYSSIDRNSRYAFGNQPSIIQWNMAILADALLPAIDADKEKAIEKVKNVLHSYPEQYWKHWYQMMFNKLGLEGKTEQDITLVKELLKLMEKWQPDYTNLFVALQTNQDFDEPLFEQEAFKTWRSNWEAQIKNRKEAALHTMAAANPVVIPRNHLVEEVLEKAISGDLTPFKSFLETLKTPYTLDKDVAVQTVPEGFDEVYQTFCGT